MSAKAAMILGVCIILAASIFVVGPRLFPPSEAIKLPKTDKDMTNKDKEAPTTDKDKSDKDKSDKDKIDKDKTDKDKDKSDEDTDNLRVLAAKCQGESFGGILASPQARTGELIWLRGKCMALDRNNGKITFLDENKKIGSSFEVRGNGLAMGAGRFAWCKVIAQVTPGSKAASKLQNLRQGQEICIRGIAQIQDKRSSKDDPSFTLTLVNCDRIRP